MRTYTIKEYAEEHKISAYKAKKALDEMVNSGAAIARLGWRHVDDRCYSVRTPPAHKVWFYTIL